MEKLQQGQISSKDLIKSKQRVADHGEVFTPAWLVDAMLDLVKSETSRIESRFLETACGTGNFLIRILQRKLAAVELKFQKSPLELRHNALFALMCTYGIELLKDNIAECRTNMLTVFADFLRIGEDDAFYLAASYVLSLNLVHGDSLEMRKYDDNPITFPEWTYLGKGKFQRKDFQLGSLDKSSNAPEDLISKKNGKRETPKPTKVFQPMTVQALARATTGRVVRKVA